MNSIFFTTHQSNWGWVSSKLLVRPHWTYLLFETREIITTDSCHNDDNIGLENITFSFLKLK